MADISRDEFDRLYTTIDDGFRGVHARLDRMNGDVTDAKVQIAELKVIAPKGAAVAGAGAGSVLVGLVEAVKWVLGR